VLSPPGPIAGFPKASQRAAERAPGRPTQITLDARVPNGASVRRCPFKLASPAEDSLSRSHTHCPPTHTLAPLSRCPLRSDLQARVCEEGGHDRGVPIGSRQVQKCPAIL